MLSWGSTSLGMQFLKGAGRVGGCLGVALDGMVNRYPLLLLPRGLPPYMHCIGIVAGG